jgi:hypothetical protein
MGTAFMLGTFALGPIRKYSLNVSAPGAAICAVSTFAEGASFATGAALVHNSRVAVALS